MKGVIVTNGDDSMLYFVILDNGGKVIDVYLLEAVEVTAGSIESFIKMNREGVSAT